MKMGEARPSPLTGLWLGLWTHHLPQFLPSHMRLVLPGEPLLTPGPQLSPPLPPHRRDCQGRGKEGAPLGWFGIILGSSLEMP